jgi:hypothetical protein
MAAIFPFGKLKAGYGSSFTKLTYTNPITLSLPKGHPEPAEGVAISGVNVINHICPSISCCAIIL